MKNTILYTKQTNSDIEGLKNCFHFKAKRKMITSDKWVVSVWDAREPRSKQKIYINFFSIKGQSYEVKDILKKISTGLLK